MFLKTLVVRMMAVFALMGILIGATPSQAAEKKSYTSKELKMMSAIIFCEAGNQSKAENTARANINPVPVPNVCRRQKLL